MPLEGYRHKRKFAQTPEPEGRQRGPSMKEIENGRPKKVRRLGRAHA
jgi:hypothetical protein